MNRDIFDLLTCPDCFSEWLNLEVFKSSQNNVLEGLIICESCKNSYRIENGILDFLPINLRRNDLYKAFSKKHNIQITFPNNLKGSKQKIGQIDFFAEDPEDYEKRVAKNPYNRIKDELHFIDWISRNQKELNFVLDGGCGTGRQSIPLAKRGIRSIGLDISEEMLLKAQEKINENGLSNLIDLIICDVESPPVKDNFFDGLFFHGVLHHITHKDIAIRKGSKKLKKGGLFFSSDPHKSPVRFLFNFLMRLWRLWDEKASDTPLLTRKELGQWLADAGITSEIKISTYIPPHLFYFLNFSIGKKLLKLSDQVFSSIPVLENWGGVIIAEGIKTTNITL